jgi:CHAT domain-containing protein/tetratricopeptide (TPR) repeat protein
MKRCRLAAFLLCASLLLRPSPLFGDAADVISGLRLDLFAARLSQSWDLALEKARSAKAAADAAGLFGSSPAVAQARLSEARQAYCDIAWEAALILAGTKADVAGSLEWFRVNYAHNPHPSPYVFTYYANALDMVGLKTDAVTVLEAGLRAVDVASAYPIAWNLGWMYYRDGAYARTVACGVDSLRSNPDVAGPLFNAACACIRMGQGEQGLAWFGMAFAASFTHAASEDEHIAAVAMKDFTDVLAARPGDGAARAVLCLLYLSQDMDDKAAGMADGIPAGTVRRLLAFAGLDISREALWHLLRAAVLWHDDEDVASLCAALLGACRDRNSLDEQIKRVISELDVGSGRNTIRLLRQSQDGIREGMNLLMAGESLATDNTPQTKMATWQQAIDSFGKGQPLSSVLLREVLTRQGLLLMEQGDLEGARADLERAADIAGSLLPGGAARSQADSLENLAVLDAKRGLSDKARSRTRQVAEAWRKIPPYDAHPRFLAAQDGRIEPRPGRDFHYEVTEMGLEWSTDAYFNYNLTELEGLWKEVSAKVDENGPDAPTYARIYHNLESIIANMYEIVGRYGEAEAMLESRLRGNVSGSTDDYTEGLIASLFVTMGRHEEAEKALQGLVARHEARGETSEAEMDEYAGWLSSLADLADIRGDRPRAERLRLRSLLARESISSRGSEGYTAELAALAETYLAMGRYAEAKVLLDRAAEAQKLLQPAGKNPSYARTLSDLGQLCLLTGDAATAERYLRDAAAMQKDYLPAGRNARYLETLERLARLYAVTGRLDRARETVTACLSANRDAIDKNFPFFSESEKDRFLRTLDERTGLLLSIFEMTRGDDPNLAWTVMDYALYSKGILFKTSRDLRSAVRRSGDRSLAAAYDRWVILQDSLKKCYVAQESNGVDLSRDIAPLESEANGLEKQLSRASDAYRLFLAGEARTARDVRDALAEGEAAVEIIRYRSAALGGSAAAVHYMAFVITPHCTAPRVVVLEDGERLESGLLASYRDLMQPYGSDPAGERAVYDGYWARIDPLLDGRRVVSVCPDGVFALLGIGTLRDHAGRWLADRYDVRVVSSLLDLAGGGAVPVRGGSASPAAGDKAVLIGFPDYTEGPAQRKAAADAALRAASAPGAAAGAAPADAGPAFRSLVKLRSPMVPPLPGTREEVLAVYGLLERERVGTRLFLAGQAVEESVKAVRSPRILHIATHGFTNEETAESLMRNPLLNTGLLLAGAEQTLRDGPPPPDVEDGILTAYEAVQLPLEGTDLVVLSACSTGVGRIKPGEGVYNLQRAIGIAGAVHVVMSLWAVDDEATQRFMTDFYKRWLGGAGLRAAFTAAARAMKDAGAPACDWGAFVLVGP